MFMMDHDHPQFFALGIFVAVKHKLEQVKSLA